MAWNQFELVDCRSRLQAFVDRCNDVLRLIDALHRAAGASRAEVRRKYAALKRDLDRTDRESSRNPSTLNAVEKIFWARTVRQAYSHLSAPVNCADLNRVVDSVSEAKSDITAALQRMPGGESGE